MFTHFVGKVYVCGDRPKEDQYHVDIPVYTRSDKTPLNLLLLMQKEDLLDESVDRIDNIREKLGVLSIETMRKNYFIEPNLQIAAASAIWSDVSKHYSSFMWTRFPDWSQLLFVCEFLERYFLSYKFLRVRGEGMIASGRQLAFLIKRLQSRKPIKSLIDQWVKECKASSSSAIEQIFHFVKEWAGFLFPRYVIALEHIANYVFESNGRSRVNMTGYGSRVENLFREPILTALEEYGLPLQIGEKIKELEHPGLQLDRALQVLKRINAGRVGLTQFEKEALIAVQKSLALPQRRKRPIEEVRSIRGDE